MAIFNSYFDITRGYWVALTRKMTLLIHQQTGPMPSVSPYWGHDDYIGRSLALLKPGGRFMEIGKRGARCGLNRWFPRKVSWKKWVLNGSWQLWIFMMCLIFVYLFMGLDQLTLGDCSFCPKLWLRLNRLSKSPVERLVSPTFEVLTGFNICTMVKSYFIFS